MSMSTGKQKEMRWRKILESLMSTTESHVPYQGNPNQKVYVKMNFLNVIGPLMGNQKFDVKMKFRNALGSFWVWRGKINFRGEKLIEIGTRSIERVEITNPNVQKIMCYSGFLTVKNLSFYQCASKCNQRNIVFFKQFGRIIQKLYSIV